MRKMTDEELNKKEVLEAIADEQHAKPEPQMSELDKAFEPIYNSLVLEIDVVSDFFSGKEINDILKKFKVSVDILKDNKQMLQQRFNEVNQEIITLLQINTKPIGLSAAELIYDNDFFKHLDREDFCKYVGSLYQLVEFANKNLTQIMQSNIMIIAQGGSPPSTHPVN